MKIQYIITCIFIAISFLLMGQNQLQIGMDKPFYSSGDKIGFTAYNFSENFDEIVFIELLNSEGTILENICVKKSKLIANGIFNIPLDWKSGWYFIRAYTIWTPSLAFKDLGYQSFAIYNLFEQLEKSDMANNEPILKINDSPTFKISTDKNEYKKGDIATISLDINKNEITDEVQYIANVVEKSFFESRAYFQNKPKIVVSNLYKKNSEDKPLEQILILGKVIQKTDNLLSAIYITEKREYSWISINEEGIFGVQLDDFTGQRNAHVFGMEALGGIIHIDAELYNPSSVLVFPELNQIPLPYPETIKSQLEDGRKRKIIADIFQTTNISESSKEEIDLNFSKPDKSYDPKDYILFNDLEDFIVEVIPILRLSKKDKDFSFRVFMEKNKLAPHSPALFLNGYMVKDVNELFKIKMDELEKIDIYRKESTILKQFGALGRNGVISFYTTNTDLKPLHSNLIKLNGLQKQRNISPQIIIHKPSFSPSLLWQPSIQKNENGVLGFTFEISDDQGEYIIIIDKYTNNGVERSTKPIFLNPKI